MKVRNKKMYIYLSLSSKQLFILLKWKNRDFAKYVNILME